MKIFSMVPGLILDFHTKFLQSFLLLRTIPLRHLPLLKGRQEANTMQGSAGIQMRDGHGHRRDICAAKR